MNPLDVKKTKDYSLFKILSCNREINSRHIKRLKQEIEKENLLHLHPILVNEDWELIDGQHRLMAAKELGIEIFYIRTDVSYEHILNSNYNQLKMGISDVLQFYSKKYRNEDYIKVIKYLERTSLSPKALLSMIIPTHIKKVNLELRLGNFEVPKDEEETELLIGYYQQFFGYCKEKRITPLAMFKSGYATRALRQLFLHPDFDMEWFLKKVDQKWFEIIPQANTKLWFKQLLRIFNYKKQDPIENTLEDEETA